MIQNIICWNCCAMVKDLVPQYEGEEFKFSTLQPIYMSILILGCYVGYLGLGLNLGC
jgi:hypothetical protein